MLAPCDVGSSMARERTRRRSRTAHLGRRQQESVVLGECRVGLSHGGRAQDEKPTTRRSRRAAARPSKQKQEDEPLRPGTPPGWRSTSPVPDRSVRYAQSPSLLLKLPAQLRVLLHIVTSYRRQQFLMQAGCICHLRGQRHVDERHTLRSTPQAQVGVGCLCSMCGEPTALSLLDT